MKQSLLWSKSNCRAINIGFSLMGQKNIKMKAYVANENYLSVSRTEPFANCLLSPELERGRN